MELHDAQVQALKSTNLPWVDEVLVLPLGDIQYGVEACDVDRLRRHVEWAAERPNAYFIGMGDYVDFGSPSNRGRLKALIESGELYDAAENVLDIASQQVLEELQEILKPTVGRWLGLLEGHHFWKFADGTTSDMRLANFLEAPFLGTCAMVRVRFPKPRKTFTNIPGFVIWCHHGRGGGQLQSSPLNKLEHLVKAFDADVFLIGHHHKKVSAKLQRIAPVFSPHKDGRHKLKHKNIIIAGTGGFLRGYMAGSKRGDKPQGGYVEAGMMTPVALGGVIIYARPKGLGSGYATIDLDISL